MGSPTLESAPQELKEAVAQLAESEAVQGIFLVGSRSRDYHDGKSDYDLEVVVDDPFYARLKFHMRVALIWDGRPYHSRLIGDVLTESRSNMEARAQSPLDSDHWPYEAAEIWYDRDGEMEELRARLATFPTEQWGARLQLHYVEFWLQTARAAQVAERDDRMSLALLLGRAAEAYLRFIFVLNRRWPPPPHRASQALDDPTLGLRPEGDAILLESALTALDPAPLQRLHDALDPLLDRQGVGWQQDRLALLLSVHGAEQRQARWRWAQR